MTKLNSAFAFISKTGKVIQSFNFKRKLPLDFFSAFDGEELDFILENIRYNDLKRFLLVKSKNGAMLVFRGLVSYTGYALVIKLPLGERDLLYCVKNEIFESVLLSPYFENLKLSQKGRKTDDETKEFGELLSMAFPSQLFYMMRSAEPAFIFENVKSVCFAVFSLFGINIKYFLDGDENSDFEAEDLSFQILHLSILIIALCAYESSASGVELSVKTAEKGFLFETSFEMEKELSSTLISVLKYTFDIKSINYAFSEQNNKFYLIFAPCYRAEDAFIKVPIPKFDFSIER